MFRSREKHVFWGLLMKLRHASDVFGGLQRRLLLLLIVALLPIGGFVVASSAYDQQQSLARASDNLLTVSRLSGLGAERTVEGARQLLAAVASGPSLKNSGLNDLCIEFLENTRKSSNYYLNIGFLDVRGNLSCDAKSLTHAGQFGDRGYFRQAVDTRAFTIGDYQIGRITGQPSLHFAMPVFDRAQVLKGVAFAALDVSQLALGLKIGVDQNIDVTLTDRNGIILATDMAQRGRVGTQYPDEALYRAMQALPASVIEAQDAAGIPKIYAMTAVGDGRQPGVFVVASMARDAVLAPGWRKLQWELFTIALLTLLGVLAARWIGRRTLVAPARRLLADINQLAGDGAGTGASSPDEMAALSSAFARVAHILKRRDAERDSNQVALENIQHRLLAAQRIARMGNWELDLVSRQLWWSEQTYTIFGLSPASFQVSLQSVMGRVFREDQERCTAASRTFLVDHLPLDIEHRIVMNDGTVRWVHGLGEIQFGASGRPLRASGTIQDITDRVRAERLLAFEARTLKALSLNMPFAMVLEEVLIGMESIISGARASVSLVSADGACFERCIAPHLPPAYCQALQGLVIGPAAGSCGTAAYRREAVVVSDIDTDPLWTDYRALARQHGLRACWSIPVQGATGKVLAAFAIYYSEPRQPDPEELALAQGAASMIGITIERDQSERALRASDQRFRSMFLGAATGIALTDPEGRFIEANAAYCQMLGYTQEELQQKTIGAVTHPDDWSKNSAELQQLFQGARESFITEKRYVAKDGRVIFVLISVSVLRSPEGVINGIVGIAEDVTAQKAALDQLRDARNLLDMASRVSLMGAWSVDVDRPDARVHLSDKASAIHGLPAGAMLTTEEAIGFYVPEHAAAIRQIFDDCAVQGMPFDAELQIINKAGSSVWVRSIGEAVRDASGRIVRVQGALQDISVRKQKEQESAALEARLSQTLNTISDGFATIDRDWRFTFVNSQAEVILRRSRRELLGKTFEEAFPIIEGTSFVSHYRKAAREHSAVHFEEYYLPLGIWLNLSVYPSATGLAIYFRDVTSQRAAKEQLQLLETAVSRLNDIVLITEAEPIDEPGPRIVFVNEAFEQRTGYSREEVMGKSPRILQGPKTQRAELDRIRSALARWQPVRAELINYTKAGKEFWIELDIVPIANESGWFTHWVSVERDITERKRVQGEILKLNADLESRVQVRTVELEAANRALEAFSYSVSHDLRAPLNTVNGFAQLLLKSNQSKLDDKGKHYLSRIRAGAQQMGELIDGLLSLAKLSREPLRLDAVDLSALARRLERECREHEPGRRVQVHIQDNLQVTADAVLLGVIMQNLFGNAWKYTARKVDARIEVGQIDGRTGGPVYFVKDNGAGFDMAHATRLFHVFQRLHSADEFAGIGVGLANVKRVVDRYGGQVWAESKIGEGATFYFTLGSPETHPPSRLGP